MDQFGRFLSSLLLALIIFNFLIPAALPSRILWALEWIVLIILYARMFSKNIYKRAAENEKYLKFIGKFKRNGNGYNGGYQNNYGNYQNNYGGGYTGSRANTQDRKNYKYFKCPTCSQKIRIPRGHGKIEIRCPKCSTKFIRRS